MLTAVLLAVCSQVLPGLPGKGAEPPDSRPTRKCEPPKQQVWVEHVNNLPDLNSVNTYHRRKVCDYLPLLAHEDYEVREEATRNLELAIAPCPDLYVWRSASRLYQDCPAYRQIVDAYNHPIDLEMRGRLHRLIDPHPDLHPGIDPFQERIFQ